MKSTRDFATTLNEASRVGKICTRETVLELCLKSIKHDSHILTLPSIYWSFEKMLLPLIRELQITIQACESDYKLFSVACLKLPKSISSGIKQTISKTNHCVIIAYNFSNAIRLRHVEIFTYLRQTDIIFDFMWIDLVSPIDFVQEDIKSIYNKLSNDGICVLSFLKGREKMVIKDRVVFVADILSDMEIIQTFEYKDTVAMVNIVMKKKTIINPEELIAL